MISCDNSIIENSENEQFTVVSETADIKRKNQLIELAVTGDYTLSDDEVSDNLISFLAAKENTDSRAASNKYSISKIDTATVSLATSSNSRSAEIEKYDEVDFYLYGISNNESDESGYAVLTNDRRIGEIICIADDSEFDSDISDSPFMQMFCSNLEEYVEETAEIWDSIADDETQETRSAYSSIASSGNYSYSDWVYNSGNISSLTKTDWGQRSPYNAGIAAVKGENFLTGCGAVAVAQILAFHEFPKKTTTSIKNSLNNKWNEAQTWNGVYDWSLMKKRSSIWGLSSEGKMMVGALMYQVAEGIKASYGTSETSSNRSNYPTFLKSVGFDADSVQSYSFDTIKKSINNKCPVIISASSKKEVKTKRFLWWTWKTTTYSGDHAFIIDGYCNMKCTATNKNNRNDVKTFTTNYVHCNLGWNGSCDGYYIDNVFATNKGAVAQDSTVEALSRSTYGEDNYYQYNLKIIPNIKPKK